ncbi:SusC/RagA family TonB-linked outer membrane protein [Sediminitomix flava]|uniref:Iron complex outermembrane receptor protein n=1 Tax=Sediminitomix flava TaxID=379075 RepID=A0A315ZGB3_SEDFL|nr:SusC/RagA family TonB-linked outer membrane protein [Sediminitomix flava]PWJ44160.1 iron complex outermembrane receptor protein [Sediminitomix flava]
MNIVRRIGYLLLFLLLPLVLSAQEVSVSGTVTDETGAPLPGVSILVEGTSKGVTTDFDGNYTLNGISNDDNLVFSYVGYLDQRVTVGNQSIIDIKMAPDVDELEEVVVVGYGAQKKEDNTGSLKAVSTAEFNKGALTSPDQLLTGKVAGVSITSNSGAPGAQNSIRIRGGTSVNASNEPLYVIDGVPIDNSAFNPGGFDAGRNPLNSINPSDIESFTVLKDASATAIYGSRAANGVILITTKKGKAGKVSFSYDGFISFSQDFGSPDQLSPQSYRDYVTTEFPDRAGLLGEANTNWYDETLQTGIGQSHTVSYSAGAEKFNVRTSIGYFSQEGILKNSETERVTFNIASQSTLLDSHLKLDINFKGAQNEDKFVNGGVVGSAIRFDPTQPIRDPESIYGGYFEYENINAPKNPIALQNEIEDNGTSYRGLGNVKLDYKLHFYDKLSAILNLGVDINTGHRRRYDPYFLREQFGSDNGNGQIRNENFSRVNNLMDIYLNWREEFEEIHSRVDVTLGYSWQRFISEFPGYRAFNIGNDILGENAASFAGDSQVFFNKQANKLISFWGRLNYSFYNRYNITFTLRRDGSSRFGEDNRWGTFPSIAFAWRIIDEPWMRATDGWLADLKLRAGFGITGNQEIGDYNFLSTYTFSDNRASYPIGSGFEPTVRANGFDSGLKWEETKQWNVGIEAGFAEGKYNVEVDWYLKDTEDLLFEISVPGGSNLTNVILTNIGSLRNTGVEFTFDAVALDRPNFQWNVGLNAAYNVNEIRSLDVIDSDDFLGFQTGGISGGTGNTIQILREGEPVNSFFVFEHIFQDGLPLVDGVDHNGDGNANNLDIYVDQNGDGIINDLDKTVYKKPAADWILGLTSTMYFWNFDLLFTLRSNLNNWVYNNNKSDLLQTNSIRNGDFLSNVDKRVRQIPFREPQYFSDYFLESGSFLKLDNITLGYTFNDLVDNMNLRAYVTAQNLFLVSGYDGIDPETPTGIDNNVYPRSRTWLIGLSLGF